MKSSDLEFALVGIVALAIIGYKQFTEHNVTSSVLIHFGLSLLAICAGYLALYFLARKTWQHLSWRKEQRIIKERIQRQEKEKTKRKQHVQKEISLLHQRFEQIRPEFLKPESNKKLQSLNDFLSQLYHTNMLAHEEYAKEHHNITQQINAEIFKTKQTLQAQEEARKQHLDLTKSAYKDTQLNQEQRTLLERNGYIRARHVPLNQTGSIIYWIKPRPNESTAHHHLTMEIAEYIKSKGVEVRTPNSRNADIIFTANGQPWAVEVETGSVKKKKPQEFQEKIKQLNKKYGKNWFIVLTNAQMLVHYRSTRYQVIRKNRITEKINQILDQPKKKPPKKQAPFDL